MRYVLIFWAAPMGLFWGWYYLSYHDINFGTVYFSRALHDFAFEFYGHFLGMDAEVIPALIAEACVVDTVLIAAILAFRRRAKIAAWWRERREFKNSDRRPAMIEAGQEPLEG